MSLNFVISPVGFWPVVGRSVVQCSPILAPLWARESPGIRGASAASLSGAFVAISGSDMFTPTVWYSSFVPYTDLTVEAAGTMKGVNYYVLFILQRRMMRKFKLRRDKWASPNPD